MRAIRINPANVWSDGAFPFSQAVVEPEGRRVHVTGQVAGMPMAMLSEPATQNGKQISQSTTLPRF